MDRRNSPKIESARVTYLLGLFLLLLTTSAGCIRNSVLNPYARLNAFPDIGPKLTLSVESDSRTVHLKVDNSKGIEDAHYKIVRFTEGKLKPVEQMPLDFGVISKGATKTMDLHFNAKVLADSEAYESDWQGATSSGTESRG